MSQWRRPPDVLEILGRIERKQNRSGIVSAYDPDERAGPVQDVDLDYRVREKRDHLVYTGTVSWSPIAPGTCQADIAYYNIQVEATNKAGVPKEAGRRKREIFMVKHSSDLEVDTLKVTFPNMEHPNKWYYRARVRVVDKDLRPGEWSPWTTPTLPRRESNNRPPSPNNITLDFDKNEKDRHEPRWRALVVFDEIPFWDVPPTTERSRVAQNLSGGITAGATTITLGSVAGLPVPLPKEEISLTIRPGNEDEDEIITYSGISGNDLTGVDRGRDGTTARSHPDNSNIVLSAADAQERQNDLRAYEVQIARTDSAGNLVLTAGGNWIQRTKTYPWKHEANDPGPLVRCAFTNVRRRHWWKARARTVDTYGRRGKWSDWTAHGRPMDTTPPPAPTTIVQDVDPRRINLLWDAPSDPDSDDPDVDTKELHPDIAYFQVQTSDRSDFNKSLSDFWRSDRMHTTLHKSWRKRKNQRGPFYTRVRSVDGSGNKSGWLQTNKQRRKPGKVRNQNKNRDIRAIRFKWDPPNAWSDLTTDEWDVSEVAYYKINVYQNDVLDVDRSDAHVLTTRKRVAVPKNSSGWSAKIVAVGHEGDDDGESLTTGTEIPDPIDVDFSEITGSITKPQMGTLGISRWGSTTAMNAASAVDGDIWINTSFGPPSRIYRRVGGVWVYAVSGDILQVGTVIADGIVAGAIDGETISGVTITGSIFRTSNSFPRIEIVSGFPDEIRFYQTGGTLRGKIKILADNSWGISDATAFKTAPGVQLVVGETSGSASGPNSNNFIELVATDISPGTPSPGRMRLFWFQFGGVRQLRTRQDDGLLHAIQRTSV